MSIERPSSTAFSWTGRVASWRLRTRTLRFGRLPLLMGIVNVTPDSFSDGGKFDDPARAVEQAMKLAAEGADILDIGGESTRPYSTPVTAEDELRRVLPVITAIVRQCNVPVSIDTSKASVAQAALDAGAEIINDVTGLEGDPGMMPLAMRSHAGICAMHMRGTPQTMQNDPRYDDVVNEIAAYLAARRDALFSAGVLPENVCLDPGIGFGKTHQHSLTLLANCHRFHTLGCPLLVGHSRKGFIGKVIGDKEADRTAGTIGVSVALARQGVQVLRVHDVAPVRQALQLFDASGGLDGREWQLNS
jgi:dihydropteroate synthase